LGQKSDWEKNHKQKNLVDDKKNTINQDEIRTVDPESVFLIGNKSKEIPENSKNIDVHTKRDTFQRFRRNNRNLEIITFDELYERAYFIVYNKKPDPLIFNNEEITEEEQENSEDLPF